MFTPDFVGDKRMLMGNEKLSLDKTSNNKIDVVIPYHSKDSEIIDMCIDGCINNIHDLGNIYLVANNSGQTFRVVRLIDEDELFDGNLCMKYIQSRLNTKCPDLVSRSGWFFQQFIKMGCSYAISNLADYYLVVDADVIFLKKIHFFENGRMLLTKTEEYHEPHFNCCEKLLGKPINRNHAFVAHHMLICKSIMQELLQDIEKRFNKTWYDAILDNVDNKDALVFSEYETYGHYLENRYPERLTVRRLRNVQSFKKRNLLMLLFNMADYATFHNYKKPENNPKTNPKMYKLFLSLTKNRVQKQKIKHLQLNSQ